MHNMQQTQSRTHTLTRRCGKRVQRVARTVAARLRKRGMRAARVAALLLLLLALLVVCRKAALTSAAVIKSSGMAAVVDRAPPVALPSPDSWLVRPDGHGGSVRVVLFMVSTQIDEQLCYALASAHFVDLPIVVLGYGATGYSTGMKPSTFLDAVERVGVRDSDVMMLLDSDILFSGEDMLPFIDDYIARSPADASALDVRAVRAGTALAPSIYTAESICSASQTTPNREVCVGYFHRADKAVAAYAEAHGIKYDRHDEAVMRARYLNSGISIHRVWSLREVLQTYVTYIATHKPMYAGVHAWWCDQSVFGFLYNELRTWEVEYDTLRNATAAATRRSPHGLRAGQLNVDGTGKLGTFIHREIVHNNYVSTARWRNATDAASTAVRYHDIDVTHFVDNVWRRYGSSVRMQQRTLTRSRNATYTIDVAPPLLYTAWLYDQGDTDIPLLTAPLILHFIDANKRARAQVIMQLLPWYVPLRRDAAKWQQGREHVLSSFIELWTSTNVTKRVRYGDVCQQHHPLHN